MAAYLPDHICSDWFTSLGFYFFKNPTVARALLIEGCVKDIARSLVVLWQRHGDQDPLLFADVTPNSEVHRNKVRRVLKRGSYTLYNICCLLNAVPEDGGWTDALRDGYIETFHELLRVMEMMEGRVNKTYWPIFF